MKYYWTRTEEACSPENRDLELRRVLRERGDVSGKALGRKLDRFGGRGAGEGERAGRGRGELPGRRKLLVIVVWIKLGILFQPPSNLLLTKWGGGK